MSATRLVDAPSALSPNEKAVIQEDHDNEAEAAAPHGISILKEIFPEHGADAASIAGKAPVPPPAAAPALQDLLGTIPSPARSPFGAPPQQSAAPFGMPPHAPSPMMGRAVPPPPPVLPAPACQFGQEQWEAPRAVAAVEPAFGSYRERLRAGGRGAFQRTIDAGYLPKNMKQDWVSQSADMSQGMQGMAYGDSSQMWSGASHMGSNDYCMQMQSQYQCVQQVPQSPSMAMQMPPQQMQPQLPPFPMGGDQSPQMAHLQPMPQSSMQQMQQQLQLPTMALSHVQTPTPSASGDSTPSDVESVRSECMAILGQFPGAVDNALLAAQLRASADCQRYED